MMAIIKTNDLITMVTAMMYISHFMDHGERGVSPQGVLQLKLLPI